MAYTPLVEDEVVSIILGIVGRVIVGTGEGDCGERDTIFDNVQFQCTNHRNITDELKKKGQYSNFRSNKIHTEQDQK